MTWQNWSAQEQQRFLGFAQTLLPGNATMPSASEAHIEDCLAEAVRLRSDLEQDVRRLLSRCTGGERIETLRGTPEFEALWVLASGAYCMSPAVWASIGYRGQEERVVKDETESYIELLLPVFDRGPLYRSTPNGT